MKFGLFYEHQLPRPWSADAEQRLFADALDQIELADRLGIDHLWEVEHHFLEEYSHSSAPEVFLAACSQRTKNIRLGHGIMLMPPRYTHPARAAERIATLDLVSNGRVEWGTGESGSMLELAGFGIDRDEKAAMWREATEQAINMTVMAPYPGYKGRYFEMPCRNVVPKPVQKPHPPLWLACSKRDSIHKAARHGMGALAFAFVEPEQAAKWVAEYYDIIRSEECVPLGWSVNANVALVSAMSCHQDETEAMRRGLDGFKFFGYSLGHYAAFGAHQPSRTDLWARFLEVKDTLPRDAGQGGIGTPAQVADHLRRYEQAGVDQIIFVQQSGNNRHEHICESLLLFAVQVMPAFKEREIARAAEKEHRLAPYIAAALARKPPAATVPADAIPTVEAFGRSSATKPQFSDRGGAIAAPAFDPHAASADRPHAK
jgi:alkanesulfonate monooxygenase SsuD/methylene tetrahydromethanopterin reductase-like flavin-dependent oxidoreductase (luciferase family)